MDYGACVCRCCGDTGQRTKPTTTNTAQTDTPNTDRQTQDMPTYLPTYQPTCVAAKLVSSLAPSWAGALQIAAFINSYWTVWGTE